MAQVVFHADSGEAIPSRKGDAYTPLQLQDEGASSPFYGNAVCPRADINGLRSGRRIGPMKQPTRPYPIKGSASPPEVRPIAVSNEVKAVQRLERLKLWT